ncbi:hypothetical protein E9535_15385 [Listeria monocytogenes]|uniref:hypothetical protein n=1 Tax=Listeria monocytogenes TaxID=1639 RepID=UPI000E70E0A2|nr:hypothetical protein [Listeria monocytogenes]EHF3655806.1 hypothetical protein [Listeria innocua]EAD5202202.1 hypothetical protein [Listeria monocytogenes]EAK9260672.1 hypothetical protein [Listeria monocytogenes]PRZ78411.1 hypothetical protein AF245_05220 [Listeria monocytogenes]HAC3621435.1 hypothetical protein [Listeria monocytogenes]
MGINISLYSYDYEALVEGIQSYAKAENTEVIRRILLIGGNVIGDKYIILNNELWEDNSSYYNISTVLERLYEVDDVFGEIFCTFDDKFGRETLINGCDTPEEILLEVAE